ncbi:hypothetical protein AU255_17925 [Methyloprofundus sedimenti]|uniref:Uncharacterized protein n=1 Tax=Methyloprofundus sedimenti TaxID=1420851 RepID=A0A1V8M1A9_9GAMM|nr:hypothetical protein [Methyloprofundus sedimenti]OQK15350.1 hypothetical protein AU255_17925 [Methyloprofundus sedimenti]
MKYKSISSVIMMIVLETLSNNSAYAEIKDGQPDISHSFIVPSKLFTKGKQGKCNVDSFYADANESSNEKIDKSTPVSLEYINDEVKGTYNVMREKVISHVKNEVVMSLLSFNVDSFAPENLAAYVSNGTKPFLPFYFANGVKIIDVADKDGTIVYKAEVPIHKNHEHTVLLTKAGIDSATTTVCNDSTLVEDLLERNVVIQYDYYDPNGVFICSFNIKDRKSE